MDYAEFNALSRGLRSIPANKNPGTRISAGTDASAIHGRLGAQVALLQSPILPAADLPYTEKRSFPGFPVDKPHTRGSRLKSFHIIFRNNVTCRCQDVLKTIEDGDGGAVLYDQVFNEIEGIQFDAAMSQLGQIPPGRGRSEADAFDFVEDL